MTDENHLESVKARLQHLLDQIETADPEQLTVEDVDRYLSLLNEMEDKLKQ
ncbi:SE1561 family protein [Alkalibacillus sp. S2W]|uniref:SE1561 family protein n=1 Tax=Alkalibacillus TaxID=331654 RepID=UPI00141DD65D|nr:SE1561 family protein [Alkalibacillus almallahensis]NIK11599.1 hypothetical protein [Alkalibacillus almallahensis]